MNIRINNEVIAIAIATAEEEAERLFGRGSGVVRLVACGTAWSLVRRVQADHRDAWRRRVLEGIDRDAARKTGRAELYAWLATTGAAELPLR